MRFLRRTLLPEGWFGLMELGNHAIKIIEFDNFPLIGVSSKSNKEYLKEKDVW
jgi:hypothetical protein